MSKARDIADLVSAGNILADGAIATTEITGVTATSTELNYTDITTLGTVEASKVVTANSQGTIKIASDGSYSPTDNAIVLGTGSEFRLFEDSSGSNIVGSNNIDLYTDGSITLYSGVPTSIPLETMATFVGDGAVSLRYDNVTKFATTSTGIDVTGTADMDTLSIGGTAVTATAAELNILDGVTATTTELNYVDGVTSNIQTQLDSLGGNSRDFTATGAITAGDIVGLLSDGTVSSLTAESIGTLSSASSASGDISYVDTDIKNGVVAVVYRDGNNSSYPTLILGTISGTSVTWGTAQVIATDSSAYFSIALNSTASHGVVSYNNFSGTNAKIRCFSISGTTATFGTTIGVGSAGVEDAALTFVSDTEIGFYSQQESGGSAFALQRSGTTLTAGSAVDVCADDSAQNSAAMQIYDSTNGDIHLAWQNNQEKCYVSTYTVSGTTVTKVDEIQIYDAGSTATRGHLISATNTANTFISVISDYAGTDQLVGSVYTYDGTSLTLLDNYQFPDVQRSNFMTHATGLVHLGNNNFVVLGFLDGSNVISFALLELNSSNELVFRGKKLTDKVRLNDDGYRSNMGHRDSDSGKVFYVGELNAAGATGDYPSAYNFVHTDVLSGNWVGIAESTVADGATVTCTTLGGVNSNQTGLNIGEELKQLNYKVGTALSTTEVLITGADR
jgi:hypothetical protein